MSLVFGSDIANIIVADARRREKQIEAARKEEEEIEEEEDVLVAKRMSNGEIQTSGYVHGVTYIWQTPNSLRTRGE